MIYNGSKKPENRNDLSKKFNQAVVIVQQRVSESDYSGFVSDSWSTHRRIRTRGNARTCVCVRACCCVYIKFTNMSHLAVTPFLAPK